jgi:uncharacterized protein
MSHCTCLNSLKQGKKTISVVIFLHTRYNKLMPSIGLLTLCFQLPGCNSLKEKRSRIKPLVIRLHREYNISVTEIDRQDKWQEAVIACVIISNDQAFSQSVLQQVEHYVESHFPDVTLFDHQIELI